MFDALKNMGNVNFGELMKSAQEMQEKMRKVQAELSSKTVTADAGAGMVLATVNGRLELVKLRIDKDKIDPSDTELLEDVITAAISAAQRKAAEMMKREMQVVAGELGLPPGMLSE
ncbi:MAG: YbaB/EbfC family nucleoid-associated protein [Phycisphaerales bacterium]|nr:YbaB/EbfC family nucleoid-associated protein [Phycisphaerales bacterium]